MAPSFPISAKKDTYSSLSELLLEQVQQVKGQRERDLKHMELTENNTCLVIEVLNKSGEKIHEFTRKDVNCTVGDLKQDVSERTGITRHELTVKRRHMFGRFVVHGEDHRRLSDCGYGGG